LHVTTEVGLRERKRVRTRRRLEEAAIGLALRDGLDKVTIDAISARADVSPRTFFNYFDSKEDAILGVLPPDVNDEILAAHRVRYAQSDLVESLIGLLIAVLGPSIDEPSFREARMQVVRRHPELLERLMTRMARMSEQLTAAARDLLIQRGGASGAKPVSDAVAETMFMTCAGGIRAATKQWTTTDEELSLIELEQRAVALVRETIEKLT
jgi:AcrR family transcriptional regulator